MNIVNFTPTINTQSHLQKSAADTLGQHLGRKRRWFLPSPATHPLPGALDVVHRSSAVE